MSFDRNYLNYVRSSRQLTNVSQIHSKSIPGASLKHLASKHLFYFGHHFLQVFFDSPLFAQFPLELSTIFRPCPVIQTNLFHFLVFSVPQAFVSKLLDPPKFTNILHKFAVVLTKWFTKQFGSVLIPPFTSDALAIENLLQPLRSFW